ADAGVAGAGGGAEHAGGRGDQVAVDVEGLQVELAAARQQGRVEGAEVDLEVQRAGGLCHHAVVILVGGDPRELGGAGEDGRVLNLQGGPGAHKRRVALGVVRLVGVRPHDQQVGVEAGRVRRVLEHRGRDGLDVLVVDVRVRHAGREDPHRAG